jgi:ABC-2 type transport system permease protein
MKDFGVVFHYYLKKELKSRVYLVITLILCIVSIASFFIVDAITSKIDKRTLYVVDRTEEISQLLQQAVIPEDFFDEIQLSFNTENKSQEEIEELVVEEKQSYAVFSRENNTVKLTVIDSGKINDTDIQKLLFVTQDIFQQKNISDAGISAEVFNQANQNITLERINPAQKSENFWITYILYMLMVIIIVMYSATSAGEVAYLKTNKVMEILTTSVKPLPFYLGVTLSIGLSGLLQIAAVFIFSWISYHLSGLNLTGMADMGIILSPMSFAEVSLYIILFILGFLLFSFINTAVASIVNQNDDLSMTVVPVELLAMIQFFVSLGALGSDSMLSKACSYLPITSPAVMFVRYMMGYASPIEAIISLIILISAVAVFAMIGSRLFSRGIVYYGTVKEFKFSR